MGILDDMEKDKVWNHMDDMKILGMTRDCLLYTSLQIQLLVRPPLLCLRIEQSGTVCESRHIAHKSI